MVRKEWRNILGGQLRVYGLDIEANDLYPYVDAIWTVIIKEKGTDRKLLLHPFKESNCKNKILDFVFIDGYESKPLIGFHNGLSYDAWALWKLLDMDFSVGPDYWCGYRVVWLDTLFASQFTWPDRPDGHSLEAWGERKGFHKIDWRQKAVELGLIKAADPNGAEFKQWHSEMDVYCDRDVDIQLLLIDNFLYLYGENGYSQGYKRGQKTFYLMAAQEFTGWKFDKEKALKLVPKIEGMIAEIRESVEPQLPPRKLKKTEEKDYKFPAKPWKQNGEFSSHMEKFIEKHKAEVIDNKTVMVYGKRVKIAPDAILEMEVPMNIEDQGAMKDWFLELKWSPTLWNYKKDSFNKPMRDDKGNLITTTPKIQEAGKICPNLVEMDMPLVKEVVKYLSLRNRLGVLQGWLNHRRLDWDGRLPTSRTGIAATHRQKHSVVVNVPKAQDGVLLGKEFRELFTSEDGYEIAAADAAGLENRVTGHFTSKYDGGEYARLLLEGDSHSTNAKIWFAEETKDFDINSPDFDKDHPKFKPYRSKSKNGIYALTYGCSPKKLASTLGKPESQGPKLYDLFWESNPGIGLFRDALTKYWETVGKKKFVPTLDGTKIMTRKKNAIVNSLFQSSGAVIMDYVGCYMDQQLGHMHLDEMGRPYYVYKDKVVRRLGYYHDEYEYECEEGVGQEIAEMIVANIVKAGEALNMRVPLAGEGKVGKNWKETH